jgi:histidinol-phosphate aminotransferase
MVSLLKLGRMVVVDEAYYEFSGTTVVHLVPQHDNLIVLRTFSKWAGLAGLRVGYGIFPPKLATYLMRIKPPYNLNVAAQIAALRSLAEVDILMKRVEKLREERKRLFAKLSELDFLFPFPSEANFILCQVRGYGAEEVQRYLAQEGILVRYFDTPKLKHYLRISVGLPEHTDALLLALKDLPGQ